MPDAGAQAPPAPELLFQPERPDHLGVAPKRHVVPQDEPVALEPFLGIVAAERLRVGGMDAVARHERRHVVVLVLLELLRGAVPVLGPPLDALPEEVAERDVELAG